MSSSDRYHLTLLSKPRAPQAAELSARRALRPADLPASAVEGPAREAEEPELLQVGDLARLTGKTVRAIHHYEELGLIEPAARSKGHYRLFDPETLVRIRWIGKLQSLGVSLGEIRTLVRNRQASASAQQSADQLRRTYEGKLVEVRERLKELAALEAELEASLAYLSSCGTSCAPNLAPTECAQCERHPETAEPDLISGAMISKAVS
ncbi:MAG TPA: MerR family transcriptional regulator [Polyangiaceae bacterium]|nr:MerR family transcriptional regulator [Polyangiaceae bacterium]